MINRTCKQDEYFFPCSKIKGNPLYQKYFSKSTSNTKGLFSAGLEWVPSDFSVAGFLQQKTGMFMFTGD